MPVDQRGDRSVVLGNGFELFLLLFRNLLKNRFLSIKLRPVQKVSLLTVPQILRLFSKSTRLEAPISQRQPSPSHILLDIKLLHPNLQQLATQRVTLSNFAAPEK